MTKEKEGKIVPLGNTIIVAFCCPRCGQKGSALSYKHYIKYLPKIGVFCEDCRHTNKNSVNVDLSQCPELLGKPIFPQGELVWEGNQPKARA